MSNTWIKVMYAAVLGAVLALTVGFGVATFIVQPRPPQPTGVTFQNLSDPNATADQSARQAKQIDSFFSDQMTQRQNYPDYQRNLFLTYAGIGMILAVIGVALPAVVNYLRLGFMAGGLLLIAAGAYIAVQPVPQGVQPASSLLALLSYGQPSVLDAAGRFLRFAVSIVGLLVLLFVGLWRLTDWSAAPRIVMAPAAGAVPAAPVETYAAPPSPQPAQPVPPVGEPLRWARPEDRPPAATAWPAAEAPPPAAVMANPTEPAAPPAGELPQPEPVVAQEARPDLPPDHSETPR